ncbi:SAM-dependent methyltransferase [Coraliomargarita sinensis]|uniref:SAM-dependent methyltransferase n=1 Tax=Coraliomargarita sinensis TaxID=2174842 RepID=A0A317ZPE1_9BACT|nr:cyclopropane-fatty-acyl-phospholipid synthase family protein [Coraliomargarita sinensis]PXA05241.1 SAM-dependent methyltransferase [Coraliomargarita sinensis]
METTARPQFVTTGNSGSDVRPTMIEALFARALKGLKGGSLRISFPSGAQALIGDTSYPLLELNILKREFFGKVFSGGSIGFGESYVDGDWETPDLTGLLSLLAKNQPNIGPLRRGLSLLTRWMNRLYHKARRNTLTKSRENIQEHYDLSNEFYAQFLDGSMTYSSARFKSYYDTLEQAQSRKINHMLDLAGVGEGHHILEIGSGWGALALAAARRGSRVTTVTLSEAQYAYAQKLFEEQGVSDLIDIRLQDYRDITGSYDAVLSCEMIEAVGREYLPSYFETVQRSLKPQAKAVIQAITIPDERYATYSKSCDWIQKHIFPGGHLPSPGAIRDCVRRSGAMRILSVDKFGKDYAETLGRWAKAFNRNWRKIEPLGFDVNFRRKWNYYLSYCEAGFDNELIDVEHIVLERF